MTWVALGIGDPGAAPPPGIVAREGDLACLLLAPGKARGAARLALQLACHRSLEAFLPLSSDVPDVEIDDRRVRASLDRVRGRSVVALEPPRMPQPSVTTGTDWLRARKSARARQQGDMAALASLARSLPHESAVLTERSGYPLALLLVPTGACQDLGVAAHAAWQGLVVSAPWPVFGFTGEGRT